MHDELELDKSLNVKIDYKRLYIDSRDELYSINNLPVMKCYNAAPCFFFYNFAEFASFENLRRCFGSFVLLK